MNINFRSIKLFYDKFQFIFIVQYLNMKKYSFNIDYNGSRFSFFFSCILSDYLIEGFITEKFSICQNIKIFIIGLILKYWIFFFSSYGILYNWEIKFLQESWRKYFYSYVEIEIEMEEGWSNRPTSTST
jgi:hypothetical protein